MSWKVDIVFNFITSVSKLYKCEKEQIYSTENRCTCSESNLSFSSFIPYVQLLNNFHKKHHAFVSLLLIFNF